MRYQCCAFVAEGSSDNAEAGKSLFSTLCNGRVAADARTVETERANYCTVGNNIFDAQCGDIDEYGATNAARQTACNTIADAPLRVWVRTIAFQERRRFVAMMTMLGITPLPRFAELPHRISIILPNLQNPSKIIVVCPVIMRKPFAILR